MADEDDKKEKTISELNAEERKKIDVTNTTKEDEEEEKEDEEIEEEVKEEDKKEDEEEKVEAKSEEELEAEKKAAKDQRTKDRIQKRIDKANAEAKAAKAEAAALRQQLEAKPGDEKVLTEEDVEKRALEIAAQKEFTKDCNRLADDAEKVDKNFTKKIHALTEEIGAIPGHMIAILTDLDNGGKVLNYLSELDNIEEAEEIWKLSPARMALRLSKISLKLEEKPKKEISKLPEPNKPIGGKSTGGTKLHSKMTDAEWVEQRNREVAERNAMKRAAMR